jgi:flavin-dependent dehydrogenase
VYDAIVIGGGPAGSTVAARLASKGRHVLLLEKEQMPRFHIGESLLPCSMPMFDELGVTPLLAERFLPKHAAEFVTADGTLTRRYPFAEGVVPGPAMAYEVDRAELDALLLDNAKRLGADVRQGTEAKSFTIEQGEGVHVTVKNPDGSEQGLGARLLIDASGQRAYVATKLGYKQMDPQLKNFAVFSHYEGAARGSGDREGDISIVLVDEGWWWVIPLRGDRTSVGLVAPARSLRGHKPDERYFQDRIDATPYLKHRLERARRVAPVRTASDYSYVTTRVTGDHWLLVGDAAAFIDPVFSTGVYLGMSSAFRAADAVDRALERRRYDRKQFAAYERFVKSAVGTYREFVRGFYTPEFAEVMMYPSDKLQLRQAVTSLLAGHGFDTFPVSWRIWIFRAITRANKRFPLTPRLPGRREEAAV